jgi:DNA mismatch repair protein MutL
MSTVTPTLPDELPRVHALDPALADQIAAGEVVERPASVVRELVDNAVDAGARRVEVELAAGGCARIVVTDDGHGIHREDLVLALTRHATSKVRRAVDLIEIATLGFRGEALASVAAVAEVRIRSRRVGAKVGQQLHSMPGRPGRVEAIGMAVGTRVEVLDLFGNVPARRKFLRAEATEVGHVAQTVLRIALVHPQVHFVVRTERRTLLDLVPTDGSGRVEQVLRRRGAGTLRHVVGEHDGVEVEAWLLEGDDAGRTAAATFVVVRRRVVRDKNLARLLAVACGLPEGRHAVGCLRVDPAAGEVDVNVHPQKAEVRFSDPQRIYAAVRAVLGAPSEPAPSMLPPTARAAAAMSDAVAQWAARAEPASSRSAGGAPYRLRTEARGPSYAEHRRDVRAEAGLLQLRHAHAAADAAPPVEVDGAIDDGPAYLTCLPGPVGVFRAGDDLLAVDLTRLRAHLVYRHVRDDLGRGGATAQGLLSPAVVKVAAADVACVEAGREALAELGLVVEVFGDDAVMVRAVPAGLSGCIEQPDVADLVHRVLPWLRIRASKDTDLEGAVRAIAATSGPDPAPRLARRWLRDLLRAGEDLAQIPGVTRWSAPALAGGAGPGADEDDGRD